MHLPMKIATISLIVFCSILILPATILAENILYVDADAAGANTGESWEDAFPGLQPALEKATEGDEVWVAEGTYKPSATSDRSESFQMKPGVNIYGGFTGTESKKEDRDWKTHETIFGGDIGAEGDNSDNSYHVIKGASDAELDGVVITGGYANGEFPDNSGAGMINNEVSPKITNCIFRDNAASLHGGGIFNSDFATETPAILADCLFINNVVKADSAPGGGGAIYNKNANIHMENIEFIGNVVTGEASESAGGAIFHDGSYPLIAIDCVFQENLVSSPDGLGGAIFNKAASGETTHEINNCLFVRNAAASLGGAVFNQEVKPAVTMTNCTFRKNMAELRGGAIYNDQTPTNIINSILWGNRALQGKEAYNWQDKALMTVINSDVEGALKGYGIMTASRKGTFVNETPDTNIEDNPLFIYHYLSEKSPCVDFGTESSSDFELNYLCTQAQGTPDYGSVDMGYHFASGMKIWTGKGVDNNWSTPGNWLGKVAPNSEEIILFSQISNKDCIIDQDIKVKGLVIEADYTGKIEQGDDKEIAIGFSGYEQRGGTFDATKGGSIQVEGSFFLEAGEFVSTLKNLSVSGPYFTHTGGSFEPNSGTVVLSGMHQMLIGFNSFHNLTRLTQQANILIIEEGYSQTVSGLLKLQGTTATPLQIQSSDPDSPVKISLTGNQEIAFVDFSGIDASMNSGTAIDASNYCMDSGNNMNILFPNLPEAEDQNIRISPNTFTEILLGSPSDDNNKTLTYTIMTKPKSGILDGSGAQKKYEPKEDFQGIDNFTFKVNDSKYDSRNATVTIRVGNVIYVDADATGGNDGSTWENAFASLQSALTIAAEGDEIWVAEGIYKPTETDDRSQSFRMKEGVDIYGGFVGTETGRSQRIWDEYVTFLSGDIGISGYSEDNSCHVVKGASESIIDGFIITKGYAASPIVEEYNVDYFLLPDSSGAGMHNDGASPIIKNCIFGKNYSLNNGAGIYNINNSSPSIINCIFKENKSDGRGTGIYNDSSSPKITDCIFINNTGSDGAGVCNVNSSAPVIQSCVFRENKGKMGGGIYLIQSKAIVSNCKFINNQSLSGGGIYAFKDSHLTMMNCEFKNNLAESGAGGGMWNGYGTIANVKDCVFEENVAMTNGGGITNDFLATRNPSVIEGCTFLRNKVKSVEKFGGGGGIYNRIASAIIKDCKFIENEVIGEAENSGGGGMYNGTASSPMVLNCIFEGNKVSGSSLDGGGVFNHNTIPSCPQFKNCLFFSNASDRNGGGVYSLGQNCTVIYSNCTFSENYAVVDGGAIYNCSNPSFLKNCILWGNEATKGKEAFNLAETAIMTVSHCNIKGGWDGPNVSQGNWGKVAFEGTDSNINAEPQFENGYYLASNSLCIDTGDGDSIESGLNTLTTQIDDKPDVEITDMGFHFALNMKPSDNEYSTNIDEMSNKSLLLWAQDLIALGNYNKARAQCATVLQMTSSVTDETNQVLSILFQTFEKETPEIDYNKLLISYSAWIEKNITKTNIKEAAYLYACKEFYKKEAFAAALAAIDKVKKSFPESSSYPKVQFLKGAVFLRMDKNDAANVAFNQLLNYKTLDKNIEQTTLYLLGVMHHMKRETNKSLVYFNKLIRKYPRCEYSMDVQSFLQNKNTSEDLK